MKRTKLDAEVNLAAVKAFNEKQEWNAKCRICGEEISGTLAELHEHGKCHGEKGK